MRLVAILMMVAVALAFSMRAGSLLHEGRNAASAAHFAVGMAIGIAAMLLFIFGFAYP